MFESVLEAAKSQIGQKNDRDGSNKYIEWFYGRRINVPWCAVFMSWCFDQTGIYDRLAGIQNKAGCESWRRWAIDYKLWSNIPKANTIVLYDWNKPAGDGADHIGIVESVNSNYIMAIEGNTSVNGGSQSNGGMVLRKKRYFSDIMGYIHVDTIANSNIYNVYGEGVPASESGARIYSAPKFGTAIDELVQPGETAYCFGTHYAEGYEWWRIDPVKSKWVRKTSLKNRKGYKKRGAISYASGVSASKTGTRIYSAPGMGKATPDIVEYDKCVYCYGTHSADGFEWWCINPNRLEWVRKTSLKDRKAEKKLIEF